MSISSPSNSFWLASIAVDENTFPLVGVVVTLIRLALKELPPRLPLLRIADVTDTEDSAAAREKKEVFGRSTILMADAEE